MKFENEFKVLKQAGTAYYGDLGAWLYDTWRQHNEVYFDGQLKPGALVWGITPYGSSVGFYRTGMNEITLHCKYVEPDESELWQISNLRETEASDILLHEMIHQHIHLNLGGWYQFNKSYHSSHNNPLWISEILRIGKMMGYTFQASVIRLKRIDGKPQVYVPDGHLTRKQLGYFPHGLRPDGFYDV